MVYVTKHASDRTHQMTLEEFLSPDYEPHVRSAGRADTETRILKSSPDYVNTQRVVELLRKFCETYRHLYECPREALYQEFQIPKRSGGYRRIDAPKDGLKVALCHLKDIFELDCKTLFHTAAFAYVKGRSTVDAVRKHQKAESNWFARFDLKDFFGSTTKGFLLKQMSMIYPYNVIMMTDHDALSQAIDLCFLRGGLPQGTPISPFLTNLMMIPIDHRLAQEFRKRSFVYTRYADDFIVSAKEKFRPDEVNRIIDDVLKEFDAPFRIKPEKTRFGSRAGQNWILGVMLNKDGNITIGNKNKRRINAALFEFGMDLKNGIHWDLEDLQILMGKISYLVMVEDEEAAEAIYQKVSGKVGFPVDKALRKELATV